MKQPDKLDIFLELFVITIMVLGFIFFFVVAPFVTAWGVATGRLNIETLEPVSVQERINDESMIQGGFGGY